VGASPNAHAVVCRIHDLHSVEAREVDDEAAAIGRKSAQAVSAAPHRERYLALAGETDSGADVFNGLGANNRRWISCPIEDVT
jgi:hypothetical protein